MEMAARYGDANEDADFDCSKRRPTRLYAGAHLHQPINFNEFTTESLVRINKRRRSRANRNSGTYFDPVKPRPEPDPSLASGQQLAPAIVRQMPPELVGKPIEDIDPYYLDQEVSQ